jgi:hypothetical protein
MATENRWKPLEVADHLGSPELATDNHHLVLVNTVKLVDGEAARPVVAGSLRDAGPPWRISDNAAGWLGRA